MTPVHRAMVRAEVARIATGIVSAFTFGAAVSGGPAWMVSTGALGGWVLSELYRWLVHRKWDVIEEERKLQAAERAVGIERRGF